MGNFIAWLLGIPAVVLILAYTAICASVLSAKRRMAIYDRPEYRSANIIKFSPRPRESGRSPVRRPGMVVRRSG